MGNSLLRIFSISGPHCKDTDGVVAKMDVGTNATVDVVVYAAVYVYVIFLLIGGKNDIIRLR